MIIAAATTSAVAVPAAPMTNVLVILEFPIVDPMSVVSVYPTFLS
jgi:hypothetical protein